MEITSGQVSAVASSVSALGVLFIYWQARIMRKSMEADHERSRRITSVEMLQLWDERLSRKASITRKLAEQFNFEQAKSVWNQEKVTLSESQRNSFLAAFPEIENDIHNSIEEGDGKFTIAEKYSALLRWELVSYLNSLETILSSWHHNIADKNMLEEQFEYLVSPENNHFLLQEFRKAAGGAKTYPCIETFVQNLNQKRVPAPGKQKIA